MIGKGCYGKRKVITKASSWFQPRMAITRSPHTNSSMFSGVFLNLTLVLRYCKHLLESCLSGARSDICWRKRSMGQGDSSYSLAHHSRAPSLPVHSCFSFQMNDLWGSQVSVISQQGMCGIICVRFYTCFGKCWLHMPSLSFWPSP